MLFLETVYVMGGTIAVAAHGAHAVRLMPLSELKTTLIQVLPICELCFLAVANSRDCTRHTDSVSIKDA